jgi:hypothetical protein
MAQANYFTDKMSNKKNTELKDVIENKKDYQNEAILAAIIELENRNLTEDSYTTIKKEIETVETNKETSQMKTSFVTDDINAPLIYNSKLILTFGALFSVFSSSILIAMNLYQIEKKKMAWLVILAGLTYLIIQIAILETINSSSLALPVSLLGAYILDKIFWVNQVPKEMNYRKRNILWPILIALIITIPLIFLIIIAASV